MRIAVYGGTFDPPHYGHIGVARSVLDCGIADQTWVMVSPLNPLKRDRALTSEEDRLKMVREAMEGERGIIVSDFEFHLPRPTYTITTLRALRRAYPEHHFRLLIGSDNLLNMHRWKEARSIVQEFGIIVYPRPGSEPGNNAEELLRQIGLSDCPADKVCILQGVETFDISSTQIRQSKQKDSESGL